mmetsp:Transcript_5809/g.12568  ORF Transcript_5809/g.12568 Transcript_5809/m.12568 type:complete len:200 (+) Transcript_5809:159-758(+)
MPLNFLSFPLFLKTNRYNSRSNSSSCHPYSHKCTPSQAHRCSSHSSCSNRCSGNSSSSSSNSCSCKPHGCPPQFHPNSKGPCRCQPPHARGWKSHRKTVTSASDPTCFPRQNRHLRTRAPGSTCNRARIIPGSDRCKQAEFDGRLLPQDHPQPIEAVQEGETLNNMEERLSHHIDTDPSPTTSTRRPGIRPRTRRTPTT